MLTLQIERGGFIDNEFSISSIVLDPYKLSPAPAYLSDAGWLVCLLIFTLITLSSVPDVLYGRLPTFWEVISYTTAGLSLSLPVRWRLIMTKETYGIIANIAGDFLLHEVEVQVTRMRGRAGQDRGRDWQEQVRRGWWDEREEVRGGAASMILSVCC